MWKRAAVVRSLAGRRLVVDFNERTFPSDSQTEPVEPGHMCVEWAHIAGRPIALHALVDWPGADDAFRWRFEGEPRHPAIAAAELARHFGVARVAIDRSGAPPFARHQNRLRWLETARQLAEHGMLASASTESTVRAQAEAAASTAAQSFAPDEPRVLVLSLNPNAKDAVGHFIGFDRWLVNEVVSPTVTAVSLASADLDARRAPGFLTPWFDKPTSPTNSAPASATARAFVEQSAPRLEELLDYAAERFDHVHIFWYLGCAEFIPLLERIVGHHGRLTIHMHLFWDFQLREDDPVAMRRFTELVGRGAALDGTHLSLGSQTQIERLALSTGTRLAYFPAGPSTNIPDDVGRESLINQCEQHQAAAHTRGTRTVLFPSNHAVGKNWDLSARAALALQTRADHPFAIAQIRLLADHYDGDPDLPDQLRSCPGINVIEGELTAAELTRLVATAHIVAIPYGPEWFRNRTSALLTEAIVAGCRLVVLDNTNLAEVVQATQSGTVVDADCTAEEFAAAVANERWHPLSDAEYQLRLDWYAGTEWSVVAREAIRPLVRLQAGVPA